LLFSNSHRRVAEPIRRRSADTADIEDEPLM
jgi:hypothetical protein